jgi:hypothetical protein
VQQLREAFGFDVTPRYLIFDRDSIFSAQVVSAVKPCGMTPANLGLDKQTVASGNGIVDGKSV